MSSSAIGDNGTAFVAGIGQQTLVEQVVRDTPEFCVLRRDLHAHPELSYEEHRTSRIVAEKLASWGIDVHTGIAGTGVVGVLRNGGQNRSIGLRADMDALPIQESNTFDHASRFKGKMHACGHDGHTVMLLAAAKHLARSRCFDGTVNFIFQPAEEKGAGAQRMMAEGLFSRFPCDAVFGIHNWPGIEAGAFAIRKGAMMAGTAGFEITVTGKSAHAAMPHLGVDPILVSCQLAICLQQLVSRELNPVDTAVVSITQMHAGETMNAIPESAVLRGTVRAFSTRVFDQIEAGMTRIAGQVSGAFGARAEISFKHSYPPTINDPEQTTFAIEAMRKIAGTSGVCTDTPPTMAAEDFAYMLAAIPGCYAFLGNGMGEHKTGCHDSGPCMLHNTGYDFNDALIAVGASYWVQLAESFLNVKA